MKTFAHKTILGVSLWALLSMPAMAGVREEFTPLCENTRTPVMATVEAPAETEEELIAILQAAEINPYSDLWFLTDLNQEERSDVTTRAQLLMPEGLGILDYDNYCTSLIRCIKEIPAAERDDVIARYKPLMAEGEPDWNDRLLLTTIAQIPAAERDDVIAHAQMFMTEGMCEKDKSYLVCQLRRVPAAERGDVTARAQLFMTGGDQNAAEKSELIGRIGQISAEERDDVLAHTQLLMQESLPGGEAFLIEAIRRMPAAERGDGIAQAQLVMTERMNCYEKSQLIGRIGRIPAAQRQDICEATAMFVGNNGVSSEHDVDQVLRTFAEYWDLERYRTDLLARAQRVRTALDADIASGELMTNQVLSRILELIIIIDAPLIPQNLAITGQEALTAQRKPIYDFYLAIQNQALMQEGMDQAPTFAAVAEDVKEVLEAALKQEGITPGQKFRYETSLKGLAYLARIRENFALGGLPTIQNLTRQLYHVLIHQERPDQVVPYIVNHWDQCQACFTQAAPFETAGQFLESSEGQKFVHDLREALKGEVPFSTAFDKPQLKWIRSLMKQCKQAAEVSDTQQDQFAPLTETLFTVMRGHVAEGKMLDPNTPHRPACADGVYLGLIRAFQEIPQFAQAAAGVQDVAVVSCMAGA